MYLAYVCTVITLWLIYLIFILGSARGKTQIVERSDFDIDSYSDYCHGYFRPFSTFASTSPKGLPGEDFELGAQRVSTRHDCNVCRLTREQRSHTLAKERPLELDFGLQES